MNRILSMFLLVAAIATWTVETMNREHLMKRVDQARLIVRSLPRVKAENAGLLRRQPFIGEIESLRRDRAELAALRRELMHREQSVEAAKAVRSALGQDILPFMLWLPTSPMKAIGRSTPHAALQSFFAAANANDGPALQSILIVDPASSEPAPASAATTQAADWLVKRAPFGDVQIMAERLKGFDDAVEFLALRARDGQVTAVPVRLHWAQDGWRVVVPGAAVAPVQPGNTSPPPNPLRDAPTLPGP